MNVLSVLILVLLFTGHTLGAAFPGIVKEKTVLQTPHQVLTQPQQRTDPIHGGRATAQSWEIYTLPDSSVKLLGAMKLRCLRIDFPFSVNEVQYISSLTSVFIFHLNSWQCSLKNRRAQHESAVKPVRRSWMLSLPNRGQDLFEVEPWLSQQLSKRETNKSFYVLLLSLLNWGNTCNICMAGQRGNLRQSRRILTQTSHPNSKHIKPRDKIKQRKACIYSWAPNQKEKEYIQMAVQELEIRPEREL